MQGRDILDERGDASMHIMKTVIFRAGRARLITVCLAHLPRANHSLHPDTGSRCRGSALKALQPTKAKAICSRLPVRTVQSAWGTVGVCTVSPHSDPLAQHTCEEPHSPSQSDAQAVLSEGIPIILVWLLQKQKQ